MRLLLLAVAAVLAACQVPATRATTGADTAASRTPPRSSGRGGRPGTRRGLPTREHPVSAAWLFHVQCATWPSAPGVKATLRAALPGWLVPELVMAAGEACFPPPVGVTEFEQR